MKHKFTIFCTLTILLTIIFIIISCTGDDITYNAESVYMTNPITTTMSSETHNCEYAEITLTTSYDEDTSENGSGVYGYIDLVDHQTICQVDIGDMITINGTISSFAIGSTSWPNYWAGDVDNYYFEKGNADCVDVYLFWDVSNMVTASGEEGEYIAATFSSDLDMHVWNYENDSLIVGEENSRNYLLGESVTTGTNTGSSFTTSVQSGERFIPQVYVGNVNGDRGFIVSVLPYLLYLIGGDEAYFDGYQYQLVVLGYNSY